MLMVGLVNVANVNSCLIWSELPNEFNNSWMLSELNWTFEDNWLAGGEVSDCGVEAISEDDDDTVGTDCIIGDGVIDSSGGNVCGDVLPIVGMMPLPSDDNDWANWDNEEGDNDNGKDEDVNGNDKVDDFELEKEIGLLLPKPIPKLDKIGSNILRDISLITELSNIAIWKRSIRGAK